MITSFINLKSMITKCCKAKSDAENYSEKYCFHINTSSLNNTFSQKKLDYYIMAGTTKLESYIPYISDIHAISDYVENANELMDIVDGYTQIVIFSIFSLNNKDGKISITNEDDISMDYTRKEMFDFCNSVDKMRLDFMGTVISKFPIYKVLVARRFNPKVDSFVYDIYFKPNKQMISYYKSVTDKQKNASLAVETKEE